MLFSGLTPNAATNEAARVSGFGVQVSRSLDAAALPTNTAFGVQSSAFGVRRSFDLAERLSAVTGGADGPSAASFALAYDALGRLVSADGVAYAYDAAGNRLSVSSVFSVVNNTYAHNRPDGVLHDAAGNVTHYVRAGVAYALAWNTLGQLLSVATNGAFAESYTYGPLGRRVSTTDASGTTYHVYDGDHCAADTDASGNILRSYTWGLGIDNLLAITVYSAAGTNSYYAVKDHLGSVQALVDASGAVAESYSYDAWGTVVIRNSAGSVVQASPLGNRFLFQGREFSSATEFYFFRARWYAPEFGRWLSPDPIGLEGGLNLYEFCANNPVCFRDPSGEDVADYNWDWLYNSSDAAAGFGDHISGGLTSLLRDTLYDDPTDKCSAWYRGGDYAGYAYDAATMAAMAAEMAAARAARAAQLAMERQALAAAERKVLKLPASMRSQANDYVKMAKEGKLVKTKTSGRATTTPKPGFTITATGTMIPP